MEEEQTTQWPKEKGQNRHNNGQKENKIIYKNTAVF
jgi:hypothetical protein